MAISKIISSSISDNTVVAADVGPNAITASELADDAVDAAAIADDAVGAAAIADGAIDAAAKIADDAITGGKLANDIAISTTGNIATTGSGTLTVAGNTTLSGTNNLGSNPTITLGSNATFPAGNVINLETKQIGNQGSHSLTTTDAEITGFSFSYQVKEQTSKLYVECHPLLQTEHDGSNYTHKLSLRSSVDSYASTIGDGNIPNIVNYGQTDQVLWTQFPVIVSCFHDHNQSAGTTITYKLYGKMRIGNKGIYTWDTWSHTGSPETTQHAVIYEVAQ